MLDILMRNWWALALRAVAAIIFGIIAILWPGVTLQVLVLFFAAYMLVDGVFAIIAGLRAAERQWLLVMEGVLDLIVGFIAFAWPTIALLAFIYLVAFWAIVSGVALLAAGLRLHRSHGEGLLLLSGGLSLLWGVVIFFWPIAGVVAMAWWIGAYALLFGISCWASHFGSAAAGAICTRPELPQRLMSQMTSDSATLMTIDVASGK
jgi:uncharacterized membrane protein HdeD (DUF308 family)